MFGAANGGSGGTESDSTRGQGSSMSGGSGGASGRISSQMSSDTASGGRGGAGAGAASTTGGDGGRSAVAGASGAAAGSGAHETGGTGGAANGGGTGGGKDTGPQCPTPGAMPVGQWKADGDYADATGHSPAASGGAVDFAMGAVDQGFNLSGSPGSYVRVDETPSLAPGAALSVDVWVKPTALQGRILDKITANTRDGYLLDFVDSKLRYLVPGGEITVSQLLPIGAFTHITGVYAGSSIELFFNGVSVGHNAATASPTHANHLPLHIGADSDSKNLFTGIIDEVQLFDRALTAEDAQALQQRGSSAHCGCVTSGSGLVAWWPGDGDAKDAFGQVAGKGVGSVSYAPAAVGDGFSLIGKEQSYVEFADAPALRFTNQLTLEMWMSAHALQGRVLDKIPANTTSGFLLDFVDTQLRFLVGPTAATTTTPPPLDAFIHVAGVYDATNVSLYINGERVAMTATNVTAVPGSTTPLRLGGDSEGVNNFNGVIDETRLYNRALSASEIQAIYRAGATQRCK